MPTYCVSRSELRGQPHTTVGDYLRDPYLQPSIRNIGSRLPDLLSCGGIVHYERNGRRTVVSEDGFQIQAGDFLFIADTCRTGRRHATTTELAEQNHVFVMPDDPEDPFAEAARNFFNVVPQTNVISGTPSTLVDLVGRIHSGCDVTSPIQNVIIVTHASELGLNFPATTGHDDRIPDDDEMNNDEITDYDELNSYLNNDRLPQIAARVIGSNGHAVHIKGCKIGREEQYLGKLRQLFGGRVLVTAPKHIDNFYTYEWTITQGERVVERTTHQVEYMMYSFKVFNKRRARNMRELIEMFERENFRDIHRERIRTEQWRSWIPRNIHDRRRVRAAYRCEIPIEHVTVEREYRYRNRQVYITGVRYAEGEDPPRRRAERVQILRENMPSRRHLRSDHPYPYYRRLGYGTYEEFVDQVNWADPRWDRGDRVLSMAAFRHEYEVRIPITGPNRGQNRLVLNAFLDPGNRRNLQYLHHDLLETDERFYGMMPPKREHKH